MECWDCKRISKDATVVHRIPSCIYVEEVALLDASKYVDVSCVFAIMAAISTCEDAAAIFSALDSVVVLRRRSRESVDQQDAAEWTLSMLCRFRVWRFTAVGFIHCMFVD